MTHLNPRRSIKALDLAGTIVSAYVANNALTASELPELIGSVHAALSGLANDAAAAAPIKGTAKATPAQIRQSITPYALISFIDGTAYQTLKRHLSGTA
ncbi:MucR family transcriptional regulator, partial [Acinetobacter baumannii]